MLIEMEFDGKSIKFDVEDKHINAILNQIHTLKDAEDNYSLKKSIAVSNNPKLCPVCTENNYSFEFQSQNLCLNCFETKYGKVILQAVAAEYYGGHKAYLAGGVFGAYQSGKMYLTENHLIFAKGNKDPSKRWDIVIPLNSIVIEKWNIEEQTRRKQFSTAGATTDNVWLGGGFLHSSGKSHHLVVSYTDENGILQEPRFGVSSFGGKAIRQWASKLYEQVVKVKNKALSNIQRNIGTQVNTNEPVQTTDDPIKVLKMRFAKGEITKEEYEEMRKIIES